MTIREILDSILAYVQVIVWWNEAAGVWEEVSWDDGVVVGRAYYINVSQSCLLTYNGTSHALETGWNVIILWPLEEPSFWELIINPIIALLTTLWNTILDTFWAIVNTIIDTLTTLWNDVVDAFWLVVDSIIDTLTLLCHSIG